MGSGSVVAVSCGVGLRQGSDPALLWLWRRLLAKAPVRPLAREPPCAMGVAQKRPKKKKKKKRKKKKKKKKNSKASVSLRQLFPWGAEYGFFCVSPFFFFKVL